MTDVVIAGAGYAGLGAALLLARSGRTVTIVERDGAEPGEDPWAGWRRPGVPHLRQFHGYTTPARNLLRERLPDVYADVLAAGANEVDLLGELRGAFPEAAPWPDDPELAMFFCRRTTLEPALRRAARAEPTVTWRTADVTGLGRAGDRVTGLTTSEGDVGADLVVDATGRRARSAQWLGATVERHPTGIVYFTRWYRSRSGGRLPGSGARQDLGSFRAVLTRSDAGFLSLALMVATGDTVLRGRLHDVDEFQRLAESIPPIARWITADAADPATGVLFMGGLDDTRWRPPVDGLVAVGDAAFCTNPYFARGTAFALTQAAMLVEDPASFADRADAAFGPWFDDAVFHDRARTTWLKEDRGEPLSDAERELLARDDVRVLRELRTRSVASAANVVAFIRYIQSVGHPADLVDTLVLDAPEHRGGA